MHFSSNLFKTALGRNGKKSCSRIVNGAALSSLSKPWQQTTTVHPLFAAQAVIQALSSYINRKLK